MYELSNSTGRSIESNAPSKDYTIESVNNIFKEQIARANSVPIISILRFYGIRVESGSDKTYCPFGEFHKNGRDNTPSFKIYSNTNSFYCWGCKTSGGPVDFVSQMESVNRRQAAIKILSLLGSESDPNAFEGIIIDPLEKLNVLMDFSNCVRSFIIEHQDNEQEMAFIEEVCVTLDSLHGKYKNRMPNGTLRVIVDRLKTKVEDHKNVA